MNKIYNLFSKQNSIIIIVIFIFCSNLMVKSILQTIIYKNHLNNISNANSIKFTLPYSSNINTENIINEIQNYKELISFEADNIVFHIPGDVIYGKAIYSKMEITNIPIVEGRFFSIDDTLNKSNTVILGKDLTKYSQVENNKRYIVIGNKKLEVIGIMGQDSKKTPYDKTFYVNLAGFILPNENLESLYNYKLIGLDNQNILKENIINICNKYNVQDLNFINSRENITIGEILDSILMYIPITFIVILFILINILNIFKFWWENNKYNFIINRMVGATKLDITKIAIKILFKQFIISMIITYFLNLMLNPLITSIFNFNNENNIFSILITTGLMFLLTIIIIAAPIYKLINNEINKNIRGI